jgi:hypothetical protein
MLCTGPETIRVLYTNVDKLMGNEKKIYMKSPTNTELFKKKAPEAQSPLPHLQKLDIPWRTWPDAAVYYAEKHSSLLFCGKSP